MGHPSAFRNGRWADTGAMDLRAWRDCGGGSRYEKHCVGRIDRIKLHILSTLYTLCL